MRPDETSFKPWRLFALLVVPLIALMFAQPAFAGPGETGGISAAPTAAASDHNSLTQFRSIVGQVVLSEDACGTLGPACTIDIVKPSPTATVREAHLFCATTPFGYVPDNDDVTLNGMPVAWDQVLAWMIPPNNTGHNTRADVTAIVKPVGDAAAPGLVPFTVTEDPTFDYDGCALKVIWNDPTTTNNSILIFWGHQETIGDTFVINFAPLSAAAFLTPLEFSLGISFGFQPSNQFSQVDVNNVRLTTSAGGQDDAVAGNLITLGGTGDTTANPPPTAPAITPSNPDDELYDLRPFTSPGATSMTIFTINPSNDDNIFLANLFLRNVTVVDGPPTECPPEDDDDNGGDDDDDNGDDDDDGRRDDDDDDDDDYDGLTNKNETLFLTLLDIRDSDLDGIVDGNDDANGNGEDDEDEDDDECPDDDDSDGDGVDDEDEDDDDDEDDD